MTYRPAPIWEADDLRAFCRAVLRAYPGAKITVHQRSPAEPNKRGQP